MEKNPEKNLKDVRKSVIPVVRLLAGRLGSLSRGDTQQPSQVGA